MHTGVTRYVLGTGFWVLVSPTKRKSIPKRWVREREKKETKVNTKQL
jgi:hypothetical protein